MSQTRTASASQTYTVADIEEVVLNLKADLVMIADSTQGWSQEKARDYAHDVEVLAKAGYLKYVDVTLFSNSVEMKAARFDVNIEAGSLTISRPGGVLWPKVANPYLRIILGYTSDYTDAARDATKGKLKIGWTPTSDDTSHSGLTSSGGRNYASNSYGMQRKDWAA
jgi:Bacterial HORMA domain family 1